MWENREGIMLQRRLLLPIVLLLVLGPMTSSRSGGRSVQTARNRIVGNLRRARTPVVPSPAPAPPQQEQPTARRRGQEEQEEVVGLDGTGARDVVEDSEPGPGAEHLNPSLLGVVDAAPGSSSFPQIALLPGHDLCSCHENPFLTYDAERFDCFDPWHQRTLANCIKMCRCHGPEYTGGYIDKLGKCVNLTDSMAKAANETLRLQQHVGSAEDAMAVYDLATWLPPCNEADLQCIDDPTYRDQDGQSCDFYATLPDPLIACAYPGYRSALTRCPSACDTCDMIKAGWQEGEIIDTDGDGVEDVTIVDNPHESYETATTVNGTNGGVDGYSVFAGADRESKLHEINVRYFDVVERTRPSCPMRDNLGDRLWVTRYATRERCARECATFTLSTLDDPNAEKCVAFTFTQIEDKTAGTSNGLSTICEFTSDTECVSEGYLHSDDTHTTYIIKNTSSCDPLPGSPLYTDGCGVCGGDNRTCASSLELIVSGTEPELVATQMPNLGSVVAGEKMFPLAHVQRGPEITQLQNQSRLLSKLGHQQWLQTQVYCVLELYGARGQSHDLLASYGRDDLVFSFGSHPSGNNADFLMSQPSAEEIGEVERVELTVIGGEHWLDGTHGRTLGGIRLMLTMDLQQLLWILPLRMGEIRLDQTTTFTWHVGAHERVLPTAMRQCHPDCTKSTHRQAEQIEEKDRTLGAFSTETDRNGIRVLTEPIKRYRSALDGCIERCTTTYEIESAVNRATRGGRREDCTPNPAESALCPNMYHPICGADGRTYRNSCVSTALCAIVHHLGSCGTGRDTTHNAEVEARRLGRLHEFYTPEESDVVFQHGIFGDTLRLTEE